MSYHNPNPSVVDFGPRLSREEHDRQIVALYSESPPMPSAEEQAAYRRAELDLSIDYRLGRDFPQDRREALRQIQENRDKRHLWNLLLAVITNPLSPFNGLSKKLVREFAAVLNTAELRAMLDLSEEDFIKLGGPRAVAKHRKG